MAMRIDLDFPEALDAAGQRSLLLALAGLPKAERVWLVAAGRGAIVMGEAMSRSRVREALAEFGVPVTSVLSSLHEDEDAQVDDEDPLH